MKKEGLTKDQELQSYTEQNNLYYIHIGLKEKGVEGYLWKQTPNAQGNNGYHKAVSGWKGEERNTIYILNEYK